MRVIAGKFKSRPLRSLAGMKTRPTSDRLRETLFNVLTAGNPSALEGSVWIDIFAGTGAVGIEAISRGARQVTLIDKAPSAIRVIRDNLKSLGISEGFELVELEATRALRQYENRGLPADYVYVDPPYASHDAYREVLELLAQSRILKQGAIVIVEHDKRYDPGEVLGAMRRYRKVIQGDSELSFYRRD